MAQAKKTKAKSPQSKSSTTKRVKHDTTSADEGASLLSLPGEIRNEIYRLALIEDSVVEIRPRVRKVSAAGYSNASLREVLTKPRPWREPGMLRACKMFRQEASSIYYGFNGFELNLHLPEMDTAVHWLRSVINICGYKPFKNFSFYLLSGSWKDLHCVKSLTGLFHEGLQLHPASFAVDEYFITGVPSRKEHLEENAASLFHVPNPFKPKFRHVLEQAVELGKRARVEGWHEDWFDVEFSDWVNERMNQEGAKSCRRSKLREARQQQQRLGQTQSQGA